MLTIITGTPGNGKTAHALDLLFFNKSSIWYGLQKYVDGIAELDLEHFDFPTLAELKAPDFVPRSQVDSDEYAVWLPSNPLYGEFVTTKATAKTAWDLWFLWATPESVLVIDEAQRHMRPRPAGAAVPLAIQMIEYHRHFGIHIVLITQKERLLHTNVRMLTGQHIHLTNSWRGRHRFEWPECKDSDSKTEKNTSAHESYKLPTHVFPHYKSTVANLKVGHKTPFFFYATVAAGLSIAVLLFFIVKGFITPKTKQPAPSNSSQAVAASGVSAASSVADVSYASGVSATTLASADSIVQSFTPVIAGRPETAPAYAPLLKVTVAPRVSACIQSSTSCICYTQQGTRVDMSQELCQNTLKHGYGFNPYEASEQDAVTPVTSQPAAWSKTEPLAADSAGQAAQDKKAISDYKAAGGT